ncbi:hypothetical protein [Actinomyces bowdenii]|uniref:Transposase family protein n=1 Tax=Actinomyces bowdenii TaxID=131109 RepID=A0A853EHC3_9ACTO|nr:hypothetical protein [Actinomyces bowdenii]MBF0695882.1 hypothetical protein [Actinomyces bowdenii]MDO5092627.1 hypothetical protein [Propionibacteriaceae bacterium]NYS68055.1 hypothetical protein [Actinomyces bowdenii]
MDKGSTGMDRVQLSRLVELVVGDEEVALASRILASVQAVRVTLMYLRTSGCQEAIAEIMGSSQPTIAVIARIIARALGSLLAIAEEVSRAGVYFIDGALLPCWNWKNRSDLFSGNHNGSSRVLWGVCSHAAAGAVAVLRV